MQPSTSTRRSATAQIAEERATAAVSAKGWPNAQRSAGFVADAKSAAADPKVAAAAQAARAHGRSPVAHCEQCEVSQHRGDEQTGALPRVAQPPLVP